MPQKKAYFILDANVYRSFAKSRSLKEIKCLALQLRKKEDALDLTSICSAIVAIELISHLVPGDRKKEVCYRALCLMALHTLTRTHDGRPMRYAAYHLNNVLTNYFWNTNSTEFPYYDSVFHLMDELVKNNDIGNCNTFINEIQTLRTNQLTFRDNYRSNMEAFLVSFGAAPTDWEFFRNKKKNAKQNTERLAALRDGTYFYQSVVSLIRRAASDIGVINYIPPQNVAKDFLERFQAPLILNLYLMGQVGEAQNMIRPADKRWNTLNDFQLLLNVCDNIYPNTILITEDRLIRDVCQYTGIGEHALDVVGYFKMIKAHWLLFKWKVNKGIAAGRKFAGEMLVKIKKRLKFSL